MTNATDLTRSQIGQYAGFASRLAAILIDAGVVTLVSFLALVSTQFLLETFGFGCVSPTLQPGIECRDVDFPVFFRTVAIVLEAIALPVGVLFTPLLTGFYALFFWAMTGQTPGKAFMGIRVVRMDGGMMNWLYSFRRLLGYGLSVLTFFGGFAWILVDEQRRGLHDRFAGTCVVYSWDARPDERFLVDALRRLRRQ